MWAVLLGVLASSGGMEAGAESPEQASSAPLVEPAVESLPSGNDTFVQPNVRLTDGRMGYAHFTPEHMPLRISIGKPRRPPKYGSTKKAREVSIEAMRMWEAAIQPELPWFALEFTEDDPEAPVQVVWKRRTAGTWAGWAWAWYGEVDGRMRVGGRMEMSTTPNGERYPLTIDEVRVLVAHEFGHVLGLRHCLHCDSAMNYSWATRDRVLVTDLDVRTFVELTRIPVGTPADENGRPILAD
ncbi:MAG: hypothetical protein MJE66_15900 [Proteobacteria bacterium]|nr:hypothetical protein [Pseudomonadota bacterium]